jgi:hypothetical protein
MKPAVSLLALLLVQGAPCEHAIRGDTRPLDLNAVAKAHRDAASAFAVAVEQVAVGQPLDAPFDAGLPACRVREARRVKVAAVPKALVGKRVHFGPSPGGDVWVATKGRRLRDLLGGLLASTGLAVRLGVRCVPATVTVRSETEVDVVEE